MATASLRKRFLLQYETLSTPMKTGKRCRLARNQIYNFFDQNLFLKTVFAQASGVTFHVSKTDKYNPILMIRAEVDSIFTNGFHKRP